MAFARRRMAGEGEETAREVGREAATIFGQLAIQREAPLNEITKRTLRWRDAAREVLDEIADEFGASLGTRAARLTACCSARPTSRSSDSARHSRTSAA